MTKEVRRIRRNYFGRDFYCDALAGEINDSDWESSNVVNRSSDARRIACDTPNLWEVVTINSWLVALPDVSCCLYPSSLLAVCKVIIVIVLINITVLIVDSS